MTTGTLTLADFLLARIAEDEAAAESAKWPYGKDHSEAPPWDDERGWSRTLSTDDGPLIARMSPSRVLAECEAKRRIIAHPLCMLPTGAQKVARRFRRDVPHPTLRLLASVYADHPDYRPEWRP